MEHEESKLFRYKKYLYLLGILSASFLLSDGITAPAISILAAFEGVRQYSQYVAPKIEYSR
jgi:K+ transporter